MVLDFVGAASTIATGAACLRSLGDLTVVGIAGGSFNFSFFSTPYEVSLQTTYWGYRSELVELLDLASRGLVCPTVTLITLDDAVEAYRRMERGEVLGRQVVVPTS